MVSMPLSAHTEAMLLQYMKHFQEWSREYFYSPWPVHAEALLSYCLPAGSNKKTKLCFKTASTSKCKVLQQWKLTQFEFLTPSKMLTAPLTDLHSVSFKSLSVNVKLLNWKRKWPKMKQEFLHWARTEGLTEQISRASCFNVMTAFTGYFIVTAE